MSKNIQEPNYKIIHQTYITNLRNKHEFYKKMKWRLIDSILIDRYGNVVITDHVTQESVDRAELEFEEAYNALRAFERDHRDKLQYAGDHKA